MRFIIIQLEMISNATIFAFTSHGIDNHYRLSLSRAVFALWQGQHKD